MQHIKKPRLLPLCAAIISTMAIPSYAFEIPVSNADISIRWDNTFRYTYAHRVEAQEDALLKNPNVDDGNRNFDKGMVSNRLDILSEFDVVYQEKHGMRVSLAGWYDDAYNQGVDNQSAFSSNYLKNGLPANGFNNYVERYYQGPSGEILDAFVFTSFELAGIPINLKAGSHTVYWGESLLFGGALSGVSYGQTSLDIAKAFAVPGTEVKEIFRPSNQISAQLRIKPDLSLAMQYMLDWEQARLPESSSYLGFFDVVDGGAESLVVGFNPISKSFVRYERGADSKPSGKGDMGLALRWSPEFLDGTLGFYARRFADLFPQLHVRPLTATTGTYHLAYGEDIDLLGLSLSKGVGDVSLGIDLSYRQNMPLLSDPVQILPTPLVAGLAALGVKGPVDYIPTDGQTAGARGDTLHGAINLLGMVSETPVWNQLTWATELTWTRWQKVTQNEAVFQGRDNYVANNAGEAILINGVPSTLDKVSKDAFALSASVTPVWYHVFPGVDISLPLSLLVGLSGNAATTLAANEKSGTYSVGVGADIQQRYRVDLKYADFLGETANDSGAMKVFNGYPTLLKDRGMVTLTFKTTL